MTPLRLGMLALTLLLAVGLSSARRDDQPPELYLEMPGRVASEEPFDLFLSANEPVTYLVEYGDLELERVSQDLTVSLLALSGEHDVEVSASDAAGNEASATLRVTGVPPVVATLEVPDAAMAGDPVTITARWEGEAAVEEAVLQFAAAPGTTLERSNALIRVAAIPLGSTAGEWPVELTLVDEFGRVSTSSAQLRIAASTQPVQELNISPTTLSVITPAGRELEREAFAAAYAQPLPTPQWSSPFLMPIEGLSTSGFGLPRRYAPGGPVSYHEGADIGAPAGTPIHATNDGIVRVADFYPIKGGLTLIDHGAGVSSLYFHQSTILVESGDRVSRGQVIGEVGTTGLSTGPHLHWEMRVARTPTNPLAWVDRIWP